MRRKMFISIVLIVAILLQSVVPLLSVSAASTIKITLTDNSELYTAVRSSLRAQDIEATYSSSSQTITMTSDEFEKVTYLDLSNSEIDDLTGLSQFTNVTSINLTANELTVDSNLSELDSLPLEKINLSSNKLTSVSSITTFDSIAETDITNQEVTTKEIVTVDISDESDYATTYTITLPDILLEDTGEIDADWLDAEETGDAYVKWATFSGNTVQIAVATGKGDSYTALSGLIKITVRVEDSESKLANTKMDLYYIVTDSDHTGIIFEDENLYYAVKAQLTAGQTENDELLSYGEDSETTLYDAAYDECLILVIENDVLINQIPSLILYDKQVTDLTGLQEFIGLSSSLNLSYNYIESIERIIELEENKEAKEGEVQEKYSEYLSVLQSYVSTLVSLQEELETLEEELASLESAEEQDETAIASKEQEISTCETKISYYETYVEAAMEKLYDVYANEYLLTGIVPSSIAILTSSELYNCDTDTLKSYVSSIISKIETLEAEGGLTDWEVSILQEYFGFETTTTNDDGEEVEIEDPITTYLETWLDGQELSGWNTYYSFVYDMLVINNIIIAGNECVLEQVYGTSEECIFEDDTESAFDILIADLESIGLDSTFASLASSEYSDYTDSCLCSDYDLVSIAIKLANIDSDAISNYIKLPRLTVLILEDNSIESLAGLEALDELEYLNAYKNLLDDVTDVDWSVFTALYYLNLGYNQLSSVDCLEVLDLTTLILSDNLISGNFDFYLAGMSNLEYADFSNNQISNISYYINQFKFLAKAADMDVEDYLLSDYCPTVSFQYQTLSMSTTVILSGSFITIDLPSIFEQAEYIDYSRTSFGIDSLLGTVSSDGTTVKLYTPSTGTKTAIVTIEGESGSGSSTDGIAYGTTCTIEYTIVASTYSYDDDDDDDTTEEDTTDDTDDDDTTETDDTTSTEDEETDDDTTTETVEIEYIISDSYLIVISSEVTEEDFIEAISADLGFTVVVTDNDDATEGYVATGSVAVFYDDDGEYVDSYEIAILGDVNGDGEVDATDSGLIRNVINDTTSLIGVFGAAADVNIDGDIDKLDYVLVLQYRAEYITSF